MSLLDAGELAPDSTVACESPLNPVQPGQAPSKNECSCASGWAHPDYCIGQWGVLCRQDSKRWWFGKDGRCTPTKSPEALRTLCEERRGVLVEAGHVCPSGFGSLASRPGVAGDGGVVPACCHPIEVTTQVCTEAGLQVDTRAKESSLLDTQCKARGELRGFLSDAVGSLCCATVR